MTVTIISPTDTPEQVTAALGKDAPKKAETPVAKVAEAAKVESEEVEQNNTTDDATATESAVGEETAATEGEQPPKKKGGFQKKIDKLTRRAQEAELELAHARRVIAEGGVKQEPAKPATPVADQAGKPDPNKYDTHAEYIEALADWKVDQRMAAARKSDEQKAEQSKKEARIESWKARTAAAKEVHEDFDEAMAADAPVTPVMTEAMLDSDVGAEMAYFLGKNPEEAKRIAKLSPTAAARELGKLEARLEKPKEEGATEKAATSVKPKPVAPVTGRATPTATKDPDKMTYQEFKKWREKQLSEARS